MGAQSPLTDGAPTGIVNGMLIIALVVVASIGLLVVE